MTHLRPAEWEFEAEEHRKVEEKERLLKLAKAGMGFYAKDNDTLFFKLESPVTDNPDKGKMNWLTNIFCWLLHRRFRTHTRVAQVLIFECRKCARRWFVEK